MKKIFRLSLALLLTFSLIFSSLIFANAAGTDVNTAAAFTTAVAAGGVVNLTGDITLDSSLTLSTSVTINGNGHTITGKSLTFSGMDMVYILNDVNYVGSGNQTDLYVVSDDAKLTVSGGSLIGYGTKSGDELIYVQSNVTNRALVVLKDGFVVDSTGGSNMCINIASSANGTFIVEDATLKSGYYGMKLQGNMAFKLSGGKLQTTGSNAAIWISSTSTSNVTIENFEISSSKYAVSIDNGATGMLTIDGATISTPGTVFQNNSDVNVNILSGTITHSGASGALYAHYQGKGALSIGKPDGTGPTIKMTNSSNGEEMFWLNSSTTNIGHIFYGGNYEAAGSAAIIRFGKTGGAVIKGGTYKNGGAAPLISNYTATNVMSVNIEGGDFRPHANGSIIGGGNDTSVVNIKGGNFVKGNGDAFTGSCKYSVSGGTFNFNPSAYVNFKYKTVQSGSTWSIAANTLPTATNVSTFATLQSAIGNSDVKHIKITAPIELTSAITINRDLYLDGNNQALTGSQIVVNGDDADVTLKNLNFTRSADALSIGGRADVTISGGTINCDYVSTKTDANSGNEGTIYLNAFRGVLTVTDDAVIRGTSWLLYTTSDYSAGGGLVKLVDCTFTKDSSTSTKKNLIWKRGNVFIEFGGGTSGQEVNVTAGATLFYASENPGGGLIIKDGAKFETTTSSYAIQINQNILVSIAGGTINAKGVLLAVDKKGAIVNIYNGKINAISEELIYARANLVDVRIYGGEFNINSYYLVHGSSGDYGYTATINGGTFTSVGSYIFNLNYGGRVAIINGGVFNGNKNNDIIRLNSGGAGVIVNGGTFNGTGATCAIQKGDGSAYVNGGTFNLETGYAINTYKNKAGFLLIDGSNNNIDVNNKPLLKHETSTIVIVKDLNLEKDSAIIDISSGGGDITLDNCKLTAKSSAIVSASSAKITLKNDTHIYSKDTVAVSGGTLEKLDTSDVHDETSLHEFAKLIKNAAADSTVAITKDYTDVPAVIIDKNITLTSNGEHSVTFLGAGLKVQSGATLTIKGDITLNGGSEGNLLEAADGTLIVNGGTFNATNGSKAIYFDNASAVVRILGGTFNQAGSKYLVNMGNAAEFTVGNADGTGPSMTHTGSASIINTISSITAGTYTINGGTFVKQGSSYIMQVSNAITPAFTINGGEFTINHDAAIFAFRQNNTFVVNGGTFTSKSTSEELIYKVKGNVKIYGGAFTANSNKYALIGTSTTSSDAGSIVINDAFDGDSDLSFTQNGTAPIIGYNDAGTVEISNTNIARTGVDKVIVKIDSSAKGQVTVSNSNLSADYAVISMPDTNSPVRLVLNGNTVVTSKFDVAIFNGVKDTNYTMTGTDKIVESDNPMDGSDRIIKFAGKKNGDYACVDQSLELESNTTYTYTFNYRATGGGVPYVTVELRSPSGWGYRYYWGEPGDTHDVDVEDTGTSIEVKFNSGELDTTRTNLRIRLGNKAPAAATNGTVYYANVSLTESGSTTNLIENGNFGWGLKQGWNTSNVDKVQYYGFIKPVDGFFSDATVESNVADKAYVFEGGDNHSFDFKVVLAEGASYKFSYLSRAMGDAPEFSVDKDAVTVKEEESNGYLKTYTLTNTGAEGRVRFRLRFAYGSDKAKVYITNLKLYKLNGQNTVGANMIADLNPIFGLSDALKLNQSDEFAMSNTVGHGWFGNFNSYADEGVVDNGSSKYAKIVTVSDDFFNMATTAVKVRNILTTTGAIEYSYDDEVSAADVYLDSKINVVDLFISKAESEGYYGADLQAEILKNEIINTANTIDENGSKVTKLAKGTTGEQLRTALNNASSGDIILLERGGEWRAPTGTNDYVWKIKSGVTLSAYGTGAKPVLNSSVKNYSGSFTQDSTNTKIWKVSVAGGKVGQNVPGTVYFYKKANDTEPALIGTIYKNGTAFTSTSQLTANGEVWRDFNDSYNGFWWGTGNRNDVYVYYDGNLNNAYERIEIGETRDVIQTEGASNVVIDNITVKHAGGHAININTSNNVTIRNCEIGYVGGSPTDSALGNGIQFGENGSNLIADHNYIYECYDAGISPQNWNTSGTDKFSGVQITNNLLTNNFYNVEFWNRTSSMEINLSGNIMTDAGYCWSWEQRHKDGNSNLFAAHIYAGRNTSNKDITITVSDNVFGATQANIACWYWGDVYPTVEHYEKMTLSGNTYYQETGARDSGQVMFYGNVTDGEKPGIIKANSQNGFENAVAKFDNSNSKYVRWAAKIK